MKKVGPGLSEGAFIMVPPILVINPPPFELDLEYPRMTAPQEVVWGPPRGFISSLLLFLFPEEKRSCPPAPVL